MAEGYFDEPVRIKLGNQSVDVINSAYEAAEYLISKEWPSDTGVLYAGALNNCLDVLRGAASAVQARTAFVAAAREAGFRILRRPCLPP